MRAGNKSYSPTYSQCLLVEWFAYCWHAKCTWWIIASINCMVRVSIVCAFYFSHFFISALKMKPYWFYPKHWFKHHTVEGRNTVQLMSLICCLQKYCLFITHWSKGDLNLEDDWLQLRGSLGVCRERFGSFCKYSSPQSVAWWVSSRHSVLKNKNDHFSQKLASVFLLIFILNL